MTLAQVVAVAASGVTSFAATQQGALYAWGSSRRGQLGLGTDVCVAERPTLVPGVEEELPSLLLAGATR